VSDLEHEKARLDEIVEQIGVAEARVAGQEALIDELRKDGRPTRLAEQTLGVLERAVYTLHGHLEVIRYVITKKERAK